MKKVEVKDKNMFFGSWIKNGVSEEIFRNTVKELESTRSIRKVSQKDIGFISHISGSRHDPNNWAYVHGKSIFAKKQSSGGVSYTLKSLKKLSLSDAFLNEIEKTNLLISIGNKYYIVAEEALSSLGRRVGISERTLRECNGVERAIFLSSIMAEDKDVKMLVQHQTSKADTLQKIIGFYSERYRDIPMTVMLDILDITKKQGCTMNNWQITNTSASCVIDLPSDKKQREWVPGISVFLSSTDEGSLSLSPAISSGANSLIFKEKSSFPHVGSVITEKDLSTAYQTISEISFSYEKKIKKKLKRDASNILYKPEDNIGSKAGLNTFLRDMFRETGVTKAIGKSREIALREKTVKELAKKDVVSAKNLLDKAFVLGKENKYGKDIDLRFRRACSDIILYKYKLQKTG